MLEIKDKIKENSPFSIYDFFGYLFPGFFLMISVWVLFLLEESSGTAELPKSIVRIREQLLAISSGGVLSKMFLFCIALVAIYAVGHVLATLSHILLDRFFMQRVLGYPTMSFLSLRSPGEFQCKGYVVAFTFALLTLVGSSALSFGCPVAIWIIGTGLGGMLLSLAFVVGIAMAKGMFAQMPYRRPNKPVRYRSGPVIARSWKRARLGKFLIRCYSLSFGLLVAVLRGLLSLNKPLSKDVRDGIREQLKSDFALSQLGSPSDIFWLSYYRVSQLSPAIDAQIKNWVNQYGYCRNFAVSALVVPVAILAKQILVYFNPSLVAASEPTRLEGWMNLTFLGMFVLFVLRYVLLYSSYYTKNTLRSYYVLTRKPTTQYLPATVAG